MAWLALEFGNGRLSGVIGLFGGVIAAPGLLVAGAPFGDDATYRFAVLASAPLWILIGIVASRRSTRSPIAVWSDFWREYTWLAVGVALGAVGGLVAASTVLGETLF